MKVYLDIDLNVTDIVSVATDINSKLNIYYKKNNNVNLKKIDTILKTENEKGLFRYCDNLIEIGLNRFLILEEGQVYIEGENT